jgi:predicted outer membrane repeat protein
VSLSFALILVTGLVVIAGPTSALQPEAIADTPGHLQAGTDWTVGGPCGSTIQACIDNPIVLNGDRILIPSGRYTESLTLNKAASLIGAGASTTVIHAIPGQRVITVTGSIITETTVISGLSFVGGNVTSSAHPRIGGGILVSGTAQPLIRNAMILNNRAWEGGGVFALSGSGLTFMHVTVSSNTASTGFGGGLCVWSPTPITLTDVTIVSNTSAIAGGAVYAHGDVTIADSHIEGNIAVSDGGGMVVYGTPAMTNTKLVSNTATIGGGGGVFLQSNAVIIDSLFERNVSLQNKSGGLFTFDPLTLINTDFISNSSQGSGGGGLYSHTTPPAAARALRSSSTWARHPTNSCT